MNVTAKLTLSLSAGILLVHAGSGLVRFNREQDLFVTDMARDEKVLGRSLALAAERIWRDHGEEKAIDLIAHAAHVESHMQIRWVWLDSEDGERYAPKAPPETRAGLEHGKQVVLSLGDVAPALYTYTPIVASGARRAAIEIADPFFDEHAYMRRSLLNILISTVILLLLCCVIAWFVGVRLVGRPIRSLVEHARRIGSGDLSARLSISQRDEIGELASEMNHMTDSLERARDEVVSETERRVTAVEQLRHADRLSVVGRLASGVAHELGTPLNVVQGHAQIIHEDAGTSESVRESAAIINRQAKRMTAIIRQLLDFARKGGRQRRKVDLRDLVQQTLAMIEPLANKNGVQAELFGGEGPVFAEVAAGEIQQVVMNILINGVHAMPNGGRLEVEIVPEIATPPGRPSTESEACVCLSFTDTGIGMDDEVQAHIFEPFFTTKEVGDGTGLGLSVAHGIVRDHGGWIRVESEVRQGSRFAIFLPREQKV